jgi:hypothetical protein
LLLLFGPLFTCSLQAQVKFFNSHEDWKADKPSAEYERYRGHGQTMGKRYLLVNVKGEEKLKQIKTKGLWGFTNEGQLMRFDPTEKDRMLRLIHEGIVSLWTSDMAAVDVSGKTVADYFLYMTEGVQGEFVGMHHGTTAKPSKLYKKFFADRSNARYDQLFQCLESDKKVESAKRCVAAFNTGEPIAP